ncbi:MAG TPA: type II secretion system protein GspJ [Psychromonas hadalis]|nr:type II secretion system protein GspJ [Psychromonas hadalis]
MGNSLVLKQKNKKQQSGFTLIEVLIAISIFAMMSLVAYQILQGVLRSSKISKDHSEHLTELQRAMLMIEKDFSQIIARNMRDEGKEESKNYLFFSAKNAFESQGDGIEFVRLGWANPLGLLPRSELLRVRYRLYDDKLERLYFLYPDIVAGEKPQVQVLLSNIEALSFKFWKGKKWKKNWKKTDKLPQGIEISFTSKKFGKIKRAFLIAESELVK